MLTCRELVEVVTDYLEGALPPDRYAEVVAHLEGCEDCLRYFAQLQATQRVVASVPSRTLSAEQRSAVVDAFREWCSTTAQARGDVRLLQEVAVSDAATRPPNVPPAWFVHAAWRAHRALYRLSGGRFLWTTSNKRGWGALRLTTIGRKSGQERSVIIGYVEDGANLVALAMNGWDEGHPSWWLNLEAHPDAIVRLAGQHPRPVRARLSAREERARLWQRWVAVDPKLDAFAGRRSTETPVIVLEPRDEIA